MKQFKDPEFMDQFIDRYRDMRNLWEVRNPFLYRNKPARKASLEKLLQFVKSLTQTSSLWIRKFGSLRSTYRKELNKVQASMKSGAAAKDVCMYPVCGTTTGCSFWKTRLKPGNHFLHFHPPFPQPQLRLPRTNLDLPSWKKLRIPAGARKTSARTMLWNVSSRRRR
ncbi:hypothetical protein AB205_0173680, partial [Aquarana catesbeiana]